MIQMCFPNWEQRGGKTTANRACRRRRQCSVRRRCVRQCCARQRCVRQRWRHCQHRSRHLELQRASSFSISSFSFLAFCLLAAREHVAAAGGAEAALRPSTLTKHPRGRDVVAARLLSVQTRRPVRVAPRPHAALGQRPLLRWGGVQNSWRWWAQRQQLQVQRKLKRQRIARM